MIDKQDTPQCKLMLLSAISRVVWQSKVPKAGELIAKYGLVAEHLFLDGGRVFS